MGSRVSAMRRRLAESPGAVTCPDRSAKSANHSTNDACSAASQGAGRARPIWFEGEIMRHLMTVLALGCAMLAVNAPAVAQDTAATAAPASKPAQAAWIARSNGYTMQLSAVDAKFSPERASSSGYEQYDGKTFDISKGSDLARLAAYKELKGKFSAALAAESEVPRQAGPADPGRCAGPADRGHRTQPQAGTRLVRYPQRSLRQRRQPARRSDHARAPRQGGRTAPALHRHLSRNHGLYRRGQGPLRREPR